MKLKPFIRTQTHWYLNKEKELHGEEIFVIFNEAIINEAAARYGIDKEKLKYVSDFENYIYEYEKNNDSYGLTHTDVHQGNFFVNKNNITAFDFDDCAYSCK